MREPPRSLWWATLPGPVGRRPALASDLSCDVAIVGGGYTGLWTARELVRRNPSLSVAVLEREVCGFGASGRNGGWASALYPIEDDRVARTHSPGAAAHLRAVLRQSVIDLGAAAAEDGIDAHYARGGTLTFARTAAQAGRLRDEVHATAQLDPAAELAWLDGPEARARGGLPDVIGATFTPHCAVVHPARLVRGLADACARLGVRIYEDTAVTRLLPARGTVPARAVTPGGTVRATCVVRATEGFTPQLPGQRRTVVPLYSLMVATAPQSPAFWDSAGLAARETFADGRRLIIYGQRTADGRLAFGGRGAPYHAGSTVEPRFDAHTGVFRRLERTVRELFPAVEGDIEFRWGGPLGLPRDHEPSVTYDPRTGMAAAGGYTGDGVVLSYVAGQALADLITAPDRPTALTALPFVQRRSPRWEVEPLRWTGINAGLHLAGRADELERRGRTPRRTDQLLDWLWG